MHMLPAGVIQQCLGAGSYEEQALGARRRRPTPRSHDALFIWGRFVRAGDAPWPEDTLRRPRAGLDDELGEEVLMPGAGR